MGRRLTEELFEELKGELEATGVPAHIAGERAARQLHAVPDERGTDSSVPPAQHVVPVSRGWMVIRRFQASDAELFDDRAAALARARELADPVGADVVVLGADGRVEQRIEADGG